MTADTGDITIQGINNNTTWFAVYARQSLTATTGNITVSGAGINGISFDTSQSGVLAAGNVNLIGYATTQNGVSLSAGVTDTIRSTAGSIVVSAYTGASSTSYYGYYQNSSTTIRASQNITFQGATLDAASSGSGIIINAATAATPVYAPSQPRVVMCNLPGIPR
jgi:hypothetical protein